jgi:hypothetical protein
MGHVDTQTENMCEKFCALTAENKGFALDFSKQLLQVQQVFLQVQGVPPDGWKTSAENYPSGN